MNEDTTEAMLSFAIHRELEGHTVLVYRDVPDDPEGMFVECETCTNRDGRASLRQRDPRAVPIPDDIAATVFASLERKYRSTLEKQDHENQG